MEEVLKDERFSHIFTDPRFRRIPKNVKKVKVDNRFKELLKGKKFKKKCRIDERGRALDLESSENLQNLYSMDEESDESADDKSSDSSEKAENFSDPKKSQKSKNIKMKKNVKVHQNENNLNKKKYMSNLDDSENDSSDQEPSKKVNFKKNIKGKKSKVKIANKLHETMNTDLNEGSCEETLPENIESNLKTKKKKQKDKDSVSNKMDIMANEDLRFKQDESDRESVSGNSSKESISSEKENFSVKSKENSQANEDSESESSSDSDETDSEDSASDEFDHQWEEQHERAPDTDEITRRLAVCHMDWDRIRAVDLYAVFNSFKPPDTSIISVKIYPSEYGLKRMEEERLNGPPELVEKTLAPDEEEVEDKKGGKYHREKLRQYQMNRLKYYYAVVECDTPETANSLYEQLNGIEYESSSVRFDLRFVPDDMVFDQEPTSVSENIPDLTEYKPRLFVTTALQQVKVGLTWDETDPQRRETLQKAFTEPESIEKDIKEYLASSSGESEDEIVDDDDHNHSIKLSTQERIQKYKALLESISEQEKEKNKEKYEMEITWETGAKEKTENLVKEKLEEKTITPFEELQKKKKEKQKLRKKEKKAKHNEEEIADSVSDGSDSDQSVEKEVKRNKERNDLETTDELYLISDSKKIDENTAKLSKKKMKKISKQQKVEEDIQIDVNDPRFSAIYTSPLFNIDPSDPRFKKTPGNLALIAEKQRRLKNKASSPREDSENKRMKYN